MATTQLVSASLPQFCPTTNHYKCSDGRYLLITVATLDSIGTLRGTLGVTLPVSESHLPGTVDVFLADENAIVLDADGDPANGMTPLARFPDGGFASALAALGYELT